MNPTILHPLLASGITDMYPHSQLRITFIAKFFLYLQYKVHKKLKPEENSKHKRVVIQGFGYNGNISNYV